jgi:ornithine decarboxylase
MGLARDLGLAPVGLSFHVGSQTRDPAMWENTLDQVAAIWNEARDAGFALDLLNIGGGFPAFYGDDIPHPTLYAAAVMDRVDARFPGVPA